jgi:hypothetical protein
MTTADKVRFLRALAFEIHRKRPVIEALTDCIEKEGRGGRHRMFRQVSVVLESDGFIPALQAAGMVGEEAAALLVVILSANDHRQLSAAITSLADHHERFDQD